MDADAFTIGHLVGPGSLGTRILAGKDGLNRKVLWGHSCELPDPHRWLGSQELLMTVGHCVPREPERQRQFIANLDKAGLAGVALGDHETLPKISPEMLAEADKRDFPVLMTSSSTPFTVIGRTIASATATTQAMQVLQLSKLYQVSALVHTEPARLITELEVILNIGLHVVDVETGLTVLGSNPTRAQSADQRERAFPLPGDSALRLHLEEDPREELSSLLLVNILQIIDLAAHNTLRDRRHHAERADRTLAMLLSGIAATDLENMVDLEKISRGFQLVSVSEVESTRAQRSVMIREVPVLASCVSDGLAILTDSAGRQELRNLLGELKIAAGVSTTFSELRDAGFALDEARKARETGKNSLWSEYGGVTVSLLTRSHKEVENIVRRVLGPLAEDDSKATMLRETLFSFVANDRHWTTTAEHLGIHRQTLAYRLQRIRRLTGKDLTTSAGVAECWLAMEAWPNFATEQREQP